MDMNEQLEITTTIVAAHVSNNSLPAAELPGLIATVHAALAKLGQADASAEPQVNKATPAQIRRSITPEALISFEDGRPYKTLRRHLSNRGLTPETYCAKWGLPFDYPMTSQSYSEQRSVLAREYGLGQVRVTTKPSSPIPNEEPAAPRRRSGRQSA